MAEFVNYTSGFKVSDTEIGIEAAKVQWPAISGITAASADTDLYQKIMPADNVVSLINSKVSSVYRLKGSKSIEEIQELSAVEVGDVYNITGASGKLDDQDVASGDNVVYTDESVWDKLAASISLDGYATENWVKENFVSADSVTTVIEEDTDVSAIPTVGAVTAYVDENKVTSYYDSVQVQIDAEHNVWEAATASAGGTIGFAPGSNNVVLSTSANANGQPIVKIAVNADEAYGISATNGVIADVDEENKYYSISGVDATTAQAGITKAAYYEEETGLIHLF